MLRSRVLCVALVLAVCCAAVQATCQSQPIDHLPEFPKAYSADVVLEQTAMSGNDVPSMSMHMDVDNINNRTHVTTETDIQGVGHINAEIWAFVDPTYSSATVYTKACAGTFCHCQRDVQRMTAGASPDPWAHCVNPTYCGLGKSHTSHKCQIFEATCEGSDALFCSNNGVPVEINVTDAGADAPTVMVDFQDFKNEAPAQAIFTLPAICNRRQPNHHQAKRNVKDERVHANHNGYVKQADSMHLLENAMAKLHRHGMNPVAMHKAGVAHAHKIANLAGYQH